MAATKTSIWRIQFVPGHDGLWHSNWYSEEGLARFAFKGFQDTGYSTEIEGGEYHGLVGPQEIEVELTLEGAVDFANSYASLEEPV